MSSRDKAFLGQLSISGSGLARILEVSRQSVSRGIRSDNDYLDQKKLRKISIALPKICPRFDESAVQRLIDHLYPYYTEDIGNIALSENTNIAIEGDIYICCTRLPYFMNVYKELFRDLFKSLRDSTNRSLYFVFPDRETSNYSRPRLIERLGDKGERLNSYVLVCPELVVFPFAVAGMAAGKAVVYFCEDCGDNLSQFKAQSERNSKMIVSFMKKHIEKQSNKIKRLHQQYKF